MTEKRRAPESVMLDLCEAVDAQTGESKMSYRVVCALEAYRAATAPLRTRQEVDKSKLLLAHDLYQRVCDHVWFRSEWKRLCSEPTTDEPSPLVDRALASDEPEACSCEESEDLKRKLADIRTEWLLWREPRKTGLDAMSAIGLILGERERG